MNPLEHELLEVEFSELLALVRDGKREAAVKLAHGLRERLDTLDYSNRDETLDWMSGKVLEIKDPALFDKTVEFLLENDLDEIGETEEEK